MKQSIEDRLALLKSMVDEYTRNVSEFAGYEYHHDYANMDIDRNSGCTRNQLHEQAKMLRRIILQLDKDVSRTYEMIRDTTGLGR